MSEPCPFPAGSPERIEAYTQRHAAGLRIFNEDDSPDCYAQSAYEYGAVHRCVRCARRHVKNKHSLCGVCAAERKAVIAAGGTWRRIKVKIADAPHADGKNRYRFGDLNFR